MDDLISRQAAIDALDKRFDSMSLREEQCKIVCRILDDVLANSPTERDSLIVAVRKAFESLEQFGNAEQLPSAQPVQWIPCSERLPDKSGTYICNCVESDINHVTFIKWQSRYKRWDLNGRRTFWRVTAWKPIPEPYERRQE